MSDLKYIMDMDDNEDLGNDKYSGQPSLSGSARSPNPSSTTNRSEDKPPPPPTTDPGKSQPSRRGLSSRSSRPSATAPPTTATAGVDKASPSRSPLVERRSVDRTESMDPVGFGSYAHSSSSANMPSSSRSTVSSRPMSNAAGESSIPVKLTPITGRVSRAKKGVPVHTCDKCKPPKTFTRAEHLRRHQLSHKPAAFPCPYCEKIFHRQDLLARHTQRHEQDDRPGADGAGGTSRPAVDRPYPQPPILSGNVSITDDIRSNTPYPDNTSPYSPSQRDSISGPNPMSPSGGTSRSHSAGPSHSHSPAEYIVSSAPFGMHPPSMDYSHFHSNPYGLDTQPRRSPSYGDLGLEGLHTLTIPDSNFSGHLSQDSNWPSSASDSTYSTPDGAMIRRYDSPTPDVFYVSTQYPSPQQPVYHPVADFTTTPFPDETSYYEFSSVPFTVRSPIPPTVTLSAQPAENLVTFGSSVPGPPAVLSRQKGPAALLDPYSDAAFLTALVPSAAALNAIPRYLEVYWKRFDTLFPLVHRRSVETCTDPVLRCAVAAVGSQFLQSKEDRLNSHILHGFASQEVRRRPQWSVQVMQAILLCEFYGRFRGSRASSRASEPFQSLYSRVATFPNSVDQDIAASASHRLWDQWIIAESRRRLLTACFVLDVHTSMYHEHSISPSFLPSTPPIPLVKPTQKLWAAQDQETWAALLSSEPAQLGSASLADGVVTPDHVNSAPPLDLAVYLASEALHLPTRSPASTIDISAAVDPDATARICTLFPGSTAANTYLALHHTPLRDLLAVSGDSWLFSRKLMDQQDFQRRKASVRAWSGSAHAGAAAVFAARALSAFFDTNDNTPNTTRNVTARDEQGGGGGGGTSDISEYWALYVCALICWSLGNRTTRGGSGHAAASSSASSPRNGNAEGEARAWLKMVASLAPEASAVRNVRARREVLGVVALVRRRLEGEAVGGKSKLLVDAVRVLKSLEEEPNRGRF
ncbi:hypothetical protein F4802DRAFT_619854 [Xylaria palmicola]|nr:hypothetical protein F4802DRAFT_619854 [Xylaria palmicola]